MVITPGLEIEIAGVNINLMAADVSTVTDQASLHALEIFNHLSSQDEDDAEVALLAQSSNFVTGTFTAPQMQLVHTNGVQTVGRGIGIVTGSAGVGLDGNHNLVFTPDASFWKSIPVNATAVLLKVKTNIVADNCAEDFNPNANGIVAYMVQGYKNASNGSTSGQRATIFFGATAGAYDDADSSTSAIAGSSVGTNVGDAGTFYGQSTIDSGILPGILDQIGTGGTFGNYYFIFGMQIAAPCVSKTYKFQFELDYQF